MDIKDSIKDYTPDQLSIYNPDNYSFIFKKTEKVACAVFYITESKKDISGYINDTVSYIQDTARSVVDVVLNMLTDTDTLYRTQTDAIRELFKLQSAIQIGLASGLVRAEHADVLHREIDDIIRNIHKLSGFDERNAALSFDEERTRSHAVRDQKLRSGTAPQLRERVPSASLSQKPLKTAVYVGGGAPREDRRDSIRAVLKSKGQASIKDISDVVSDCSEKTIQRELISMIKDGEIVREGERRWSTYKLVS